VNGIIGKVPVLKCIIGEGWEIPDLAPNWNLDRGRTKPSTANFNIREEGVGALGMGLKGSYKVC
jgi:hypothetical protein